jgi:hypothetical protein
MGKVIVIANFRGWRRAAKKKENKKKKETHTIPHTITFFAIIMLLVFIVIKNNLELKVDFLGIVYLLIECIRVGMGKECPSLVHLFD